MKTKSTRRPTKPKPAEQLEAMEFLLGQALLAIEADSAAMREKTNRLEAALTAIAPGQLAPPSEEEQEEIPFTLDALGHWMQTCLRQARAHRALTARQMVAIGELTDRVLALGSALTPEPALPAGPGAQAAIQKAKRPPAAG